MIRYTLVFSITVLVICSPALARDYFVAAADTEVTHVPDGSWEKPWPSLLAALKAAELVGVGGDRILLLAGHHGPLEVSGLHFDPPLTITSASHNTAHVDFVKIMSSKGLTVQNLKVWPRKPEEIRAIASASWDSKNIRFENLIIMSRPQADHHYLDWNKKNWLGPWRNHGILMDSPNSTIEDNTIVGIDFGITTTGSNTSVLGNRVLGFSGDALRSLGDDTVVSENYVENCVKVNENHDDGFQAWAPRGKAAKNRSSLSNLTIANNMILEWTGPNDHPLRCRLQGIGLFDGPYRNVVITNNVIAVSAYHGIAIYGGHGVTITHNTVVHSDPNRGEDFPWIRVNDQKSGAPASDLIVANNLAMGYANATSAPLPPFRLTNAQITRPFPLFKNATEHDYRPRADSEVIDAGKSAYAPDHDINGQPRPQGNAPDLGAYEVR